MIRGCDTSHHNGVVDWAKEKKLGIDFCFLKATEGTGFKDPRFDFNFREAPKAGILTGSYHFFHPNLDPIDQADFYLKTTGGKSALVLDWESTGNMRSSVNKARALQWLQHVEKQTGKQPLIYASPGFLVQLGDLSAFGLHKWWVAEYGVTSPRVIAPWKSWAFWQYSDSHGRDLNVFSGTAEELKAFFA